ncbi:MAG: NAD(P)(+) transhydrogenase (Re/Si-specific) subunit beta [Myxococcales bacterium]|jgi:NAD(P) transhydrogenase subunit beta
MSARATVIALVYLLSAVLFIFGLKRLSKVRTAHRGNAIAASGMLLAVVGTLVELGRVDSRWIIAGTVVGGAIGAVAAVRVKMTAMPELVALLNGLGGAASALVALSVYWSGVVALRAPGAAAAFDPAAAATAGISVLVGALTLSGSLVAFGKLHLVALALLLASLGAIAYFAYSAGAAEPGAKLLIGLSCASLVLGILLVIPIGGADMPVVISLLNSYSGVAAAATGFVIGNNLLIIAGALVGAAGLILTRIMCRAMNRSLPSVVLGGFGGEAVAPTGTDEYQSVRAATPEEAAVVLEAAGSVVIVPGYGLAVSQAQHATRELADLLEQHGARVSFAIHPVAGRMPGHMNVLLAEAEVPYEKLVEMEQINPDLQDTDVALIIGANDVVNPAAETKKDSPIYGMPIIQAYNAKTVFIVKRSLGSGYAGIKNELFEAPNASMIFGDAKKVLQALVAELKQG